MITAADILHGSILIVDDLAANIAVLEQMLRGAGYTAITTTQDPRTVCDLHRQHRYDLILLDLQMPGRDGFQVMADLKEIEPDGLPVLVITAQPGHKLRALKAGARDFISKPFDLGEVLARVHNLLEIRLLHRSELALNTTRLDNSQRLAGIGDWKYNFADRRLLWSEEVYRILGISRDNFPPDSETFYRHVHPDDLAHVHREKKVAAEGLRRVDFEHRIIRPGGEVRHIHQITGMVLDDQGRPAQESGTLQDITERKLAEGSLRQSEERYRTMFEHNPTPMWVFDPKTLEFLAVNDATLALYGYTRAEFLQLSARDIRPPEAVPDFLRRNAAAPEEFQGANRSHHLKRNGTVFPVDIFAHGIDFAGRPARLVLGVDRTETERAAAALQRQQAELRVLFDLVPAMICFKDTKNVFLRVNRRLAETTGKTVAEIEGKSVEEIFPEAAAKYYADDLEVIRSGKPKLGIIETLRGADGQDLWVQTDKVPYFDNDRKVVGLVLMVQDITARKLAEAALRDSEERFKFVARAVSDAVWDWNLVTNNSWWNEGFFTAFGYTDGEMQPSTEAWTSRIHPDERQVVADSIHAAIASRAITWSAEYRFQRKDGSYAAVQDRGYILRDAAGKGLRMVGGLRDLTEQKKMEAQYLRAQRMDSIGTLAGGIAHDLNNVLAPILMSIELLKADSGSDPGRRKILDTIFLSCRRGADLVRQVMSFARGLDGQRVAIRMRHLIDDLEGMIGETFPRNIQIVSEVPNDIWPITGDPTQLHQVLLNLTVNARDAMPHGGTLTIAATNVTLDAQYAGTSHEAKPGPHVLLKVTDTGMGIPPEVRDRIFEPFFTTKELGKGTGIGLATVHAIVKSHGGFVTVESEVGRGTTFVVHLPADPSLRSNLTQHPFAPVDLPRGRDELVLVVDDEPSIREITQQTLEAFGYRVIAASDGAEAIALYAMRSHEIAAVLTDMMMPVMDGAATINVIQRINPAAKIIAASGIDSKDTLSRIGTAGVKHFLAKPYTGETLLLLMREVIDAPAPTCPRSFESAAAARVRPPRLPG